MGRHWAHFDVPFVYKESKMLYIISFIVGAFVGWNFPQPEFAKKIQERVITLFNK